MGRLHLIAVSTGVCFVQSLVAEVLYVYASSDKVRVFVHTLCYVTSMLVSRLIKPIIKELYVILLQINIFQINIKKNEVKPAM